MEGRKNVQRPTMVVNLYGGPGTGKTIATWELAVKKQGVVTEYVPEYVKELVREDRLLLKLETAVMAFFTGLYVRHSERFRFVA